MKYILKIFNFIIVFIILSISFIYAHPHLFIESNPTFVFKENKFACVQIQWIWDELFSDAILMDCDKNNDLEFDKEEINSVYKDCFIYIQEYDFFTILEINSNKIEYDVTDFTATIDKKTRKVTYYFNFRPKKVPSKIKQITLIQNDPTIYTSFRSKDKNAKEYEYYGIQFEMEVE